MSNQFYFLFNSGTDLANRGMVFTAATAYGGVLPIVGGENTNAGRANNTVFRTFGAWDVTPTGAGADAIIGILDVGQFKKSQLRSCVITGYTAPVKQQSTVTFTLAGTTTYLAVGSQLQVRVGYIPGTRFGQFYDDTVVPNRSYYADVTTNTTLSVAGGSAYEAFFLSLQTQMANDPKSPCILKTITLAVDTGNTKATLLFEAKTAGVGFEVEMLPEMQTIYGTTSIVTGSTASTVANVVGVNTSDQVSLLVQRKDKTTWSDRSFFVVPGSQYASVEMTFEGLEVTGYANDGFTENRNGVSNITLFFDTGSAAWTDIETFFQEFAV